MLGHNPIVQSRLQNIASTLTWAANLATCSIKDVSNTESNCQMAETLIEDALAVLKKLRNDAPAPIVSNRGD